MTIINEVLKEIQEEFIKSTNFTLQDLINAPFKSWGGGASYQTHVIVYKDKQMKYGKGSYVKMNKNKWTYNSWYNTSSISSQFYTNESLFDKIKQDKANGYTLVLRIDNNFK